MEFPPVKYTTISSTAHAQEGYEYDQCRMEEDDDCRQTVCMHTACHCSNDILFRAKSSQNSVSDLMASIRTAVLRYILLRRRRIKKSTWRTIASCVLILLCVVYLELTGAIFKKFFFETNFNVGFKYPADLENFPQVVKRFINHRSDDSSDFEPEPINPAYSRVTFLHKADSVADVRSGLLIIVKSATANFSKRKAIRLTWGGRIYLKQNVLPPKLQTRVVFICGIPNDRDRDQLLAEERDFGDIVLAHFEDTYENNTFKTMLAMRWAVEEVKSFKYLMIVDDDMYVSPTNVIEFIRKIPNMQVTNVVSNDSGVPAFYISDESKDDVSSEDLISFKNKPLIMGQLIIDAKPYRNLLGTGSKWSMSLDDYPYNYFPPYVAGGAILFDNSAVTDLYYASFFTKHCWIDDVYVGILAYKLGITLTHSNFMDSSYRGNLGLRLRDRFSKMIAVHGLECPEQLVQLWTTVDIEALTDCYYFSNSTL